MTAFQKYVAKILERQNHRSQAVCDLGCGPNKFPGSYGVDSFSFAGVDKIVNLNEPNWDLKDSAYGIVIAHQLFEHIDDPIMFFKSLHRITQARGLVFVAVPHFTSANSFRDPTHKRHLSALWSDTLTKDNYLKNIVGGFEAVDVQLTFGGGWKDSLARLYIRLFGLEKFERRMAFILPGLDVYTVLRVIK